MSEESDNETETYGSQHGESLSITVEDDGATTGPCEGTTSSAFYQPEDEDGKIKHRFDENDETSDETDEDDAVADVFVYECPRSIPTDDGDTESCDGVHESSKDYGGHVFRACPECDEDVAMVKA